MIDFCTPTHIYGFKQSSNSFNFEIRRNRRDKRKLGIITI
jgi:hypothetical protein